MKRIQLYAAGVVLAVVPAVVGLAGNASFSQSVPVRAPERASTPTPTPKPAATRTRDANDDHGRRQGGHGVDDGPNHDVGDDHGRGVDDGPNHDVGDDHVGSSGRDNTGSGRSGSDDSSGSSDPGASGGSGDDSGHHSGGDDGGSGGHGSDD